MKNLQEHFSVFAAASTGIGMSYIDIEHALRVIILIGSAIYVWRRALKGKRKKEKDEEL